MRFHQVLVSASPGDAVSAHAFELRSLLRRLGPSEIFVRHRHAELAEEVHYLERYGDFVAPPAGDDVLIYHVSIGDPEIFGFVSRRPERLVLVYHNISPAEAFAPYAPWFAGLLDEGRRELAALRDRVTLALAVSRFNADELSALGYRDVRVTPLIFDPAALLDVPSDRHTANHLRERVDGPVLLFVGQILPHKRPDFLVQAFHALVTYLRPDAHLIMVGNARLPAFSAALQRQIVELGLHRAWITGRVTATSLRSFYDRADVFVTASEHEGFCVPLLEAMTFDLPVVARAAAAVPETLGDGGLLLDPADGPLVLAEVWDQLLGDPGLREALVARGRRRLGDFDADGARRAALEALASVV